MRKTIALLGTAALVLALSACSGGTATDGGSRDAQTATSASAEMPDDAIKMEEIDWTVGEQIVDGERRVGFSYINGSGYALVGLEIDFVQSEDVTDEQRSVFADMYAEGSGYVPPVDASELYVTADNQHFAEPGDEVEPWACELSYSLTDLTMEQFALMEPSMAHIRFIGEDGDIHTEHYDFVNDTYQLDTGQVEESITSESWPESELAQMMPQMESAAIVVQNDDASSFEVRVYGASADDLSAYAGRCKEAGFDEVVSEIGQNSSLRNAEGYSLEISYYPLYDYYYAKVMPPTA